ncbi:hypothetical protein DFH28DRAFT_1031147 [Melampsora americana]|nr:hypothetical protein DFH28DRAFT_1031147 [Melampsora americana]
MPSNPPPTNRSRLDPSASILSLPNTQSHQTAPNLIQPRRRRVSDGSTGTSLRKDILLSKLAEALTLERNKSNVFQKELQNAEHEIDELASQLDQAKREHYQVLSTLKKEIKLLKKEKDGLILALEAAEGIDQDEADKYLALIDPTQAILMEKEDDNGIEGNEVDDQSLHHPPPRDHPLEHHETVRAQAQKRSAVRARRINEELSKLGPSIDSTTSLPTTEIENRNPMEKREEMELNQKFEIETDQALRGRRVAPTERHRRKLSKTRVESHHHHQTGGFWKRSGSRNREVKEGLNRRHRMNSNPSECYDSGSLQTRHQVLSHQQSGASKIGKLFRKVFPVHGNQEEEEESGVNQAYDIGDEYVEEQKRLEALIKEHHQEVGPNRERNQVRNSVGGAGGGGGGQRRRGNSRTR